MRLRTGLLALAGGLALALLSSAKDGEATATYSEIMGCETGCTVAAGGWPAPYLVDYPGISVVGSVDLLGGLIGEDKLRPLPFFLTWLFWAAAVAAVLLLARRVRGGRR
ncbi:MAG: hypothetical protein ACK40O_04040 [Allosphingosinicella sp.]